MAKRVHDVVSELKAAGARVLFSLNYPTVPAGPSPKFWEYTYGVPVVGIQKLYGKTGRADFQAYVKKSFGPNRLG